MAAARENKDLDGITTTPAIDETKRIPMKLRDLVHVLLKTAGEELKELQAVCEEDARHNVLFQDRGPDREADERLRNYQLGNCFYSVITDIANNLVNCIRRVSPQHFALLLAYKMWKPTVSKIIDGIVAQLKVEYPIEHGRLIVFEPTESPQDLYLKLLDGSFTLEQSELPAIQKQLASLKIMMEKENRRIAFLSLLNKNNFFKGSSLFRAIQEKAVIKKIFEAAGIESSYAEARRSRKPS